MTNTPESISYIQLNEDIHPIDAVSIEGKLISDFQEAGKIVQTISASSTHDEIPSAKCIYELVYGSYTPPVHDYNQEPLTFNILSAGTINWTASDTTVTKTIDYKLNDGEWVSIASNTDSSAPTIEVNPGDKIQFRGDNTAYCGDNPELYNTFGGSTAEFEIEGNIMSLINSTDFSTLTTLESNFTFAFLFSNCTGLTSAENLILPATPLTMGCYLTMFYGCTSLTTAPKLPATTLAMGCYVSMFQDCTSLTTAPSALPATTLASNCYSSMFQGCTSLTTAPKLPATTLAEYCYDSMFRGCTSLTTVPELPATTLAESCYSSMFESCSSLTTAPELPATTLTANCYGYMFSGCKKLTTAPALPATSLADSCYQYMFQNCTSLTTAPELPATTLTNSCYSYMFQGCTSLNYIKCLATDISASNCTMDWVDGVADTGTFVQNPDMDEWETGVDGIPVNWTVEGGHSDFSTKPLTFSILSAGTIKWTALNTATNKKTIEYKLNNGEWTSITSNTGSSAPTITVNSGDKIQFRGNNEQYATSYSNYNSFSGSTALFKAKGNIMSLIYGDDFKNKLTISSTYAFARLFRDCTKLVSAGNLILPATTLADYCYFGMFDSCSSLTTAPALPATTLAENCYNSMFFSCKSLTKAPALPATTLADYCYNSMFMDCTSLTTAPELPATTLAPYCYYQMFYVCTSLTSAPALPANTLANGCYSYMFQGCTKLTTAPVLPATNLKVNCYQYMFNGCTKLNYIECLATDISAYNCTYNWVDGVASTGTFVKAAGMSRWTTGTSGIPRGWTVEEYIDYTKEPLTFNILSAGRINWKASNSAVTKTIEYKLNDGGWTSITSKAGYSVPTINVVEGDKIQFRGNNEQYATNTSKYNSFSGSTASFEAEGNIMSLIYGDDFKNNSTISSTHTFVGLFRDCANLVSAENLVLPAEDLAASCYWNMFQGCTKLTTAPVLPATTLADSCYAGMFKGCASLTTAPELPATILPNSCYSTMFNGCTSLTKAPELPATNLANYCYASMFSRCTSLTTAPVLPATTLASYCYYYMFNGCTSLTKAPELPATTLATYCYQEMFNGCTNLNYIKCLATKISASDCTYNWVSGVASTGTFVKSPNMTSWPTGTKGIPKGWTVQNA